MSELTSLIREGLCLGEKLSRYSPAYGRLQTITEKVNGLAEDAYDMQDRKEQYARTLAEDAIKLGRSVDGYIVRTRNLFYQNLLEDGYSTDPTTGLVQPSSQRTTNLTPFDIENSGSITVSYTGSSDIRYIFTLFKEDGTLLQRKAAMTNGSNFSTTGAKWLYLTFYNPSGPHVSKSDITNLMVNAGNVALNYEEYGYVLDNSYFENYFDPERDQIYDATVSGGKWKAATAKSTKFKIQPGLTYDFTIRPSKTTLARIAFFKNEPQLDDEVQGRLAFDYSSSATEVNQTLKANDDENWVIFQGLSSDFNLWGKSLSVKEHDTVYNQNYPRS